MNLTLPDSNIVVYTAVSPNYDTLQPVPTIWRNQARFVAFLEGETSSPGWEKRPLHQEFEDSCRNAKIHKILPHRYFPDADYSIWVDGCVQIKSNTQLVDLLASALCAHDIALYRHRRRGCIYEEAEACKAANKDSPAVIDRQIAAYKSEGYPANNGLAECTVILRRHTPDMLRFNEAWYNEINAHSRRDQLSFNYVAHKLGIEYARLPGTIARNEHFQRLKHKYTTDVPEQTGSSLPI